MSDPSGAASAGAASTAAPSPSPASASASASSSSTPAPAAADVLVQYVVMRNDLIKQHKWNVGGLISNGSHACVAVVVENLSDPSVQAYVDPAAVTQMHKVVLAAKDDDELAATAELLTQNKITHKVWVEQPENFRSCLATKPYPRSIIQPILKHLKLFR